jgi:hypothetical protein
MVTAIVDETMLSPIGGDLLRAFKGIALLLERIRADYVMASKHSKVWVAQITESLQLFEILFHSGHVDDDGRALLWRELDRLPDCDAREQVASGRECAINRLNQLRACALIVVPCRTGTEQFDGRKLFLIGTESAALEFYREAPELGDFSKAEFIANSRRAYPNLYFREGIENQLDRFSRPYLAMRPALIEALSDLNDHLPPIVDEVKSGFVVARRFNAMSRYSISPESPQPHQNKSAMKERQVEFRDVKIGEVRLGNINVNCEWHLKLEPDRDRVHFYFGYQKILIGIFSEHLST